MGIGHDEGLDRLRVLMILGHISDLHITEGPRLEETMRCLTWAVDEGNRRGVDCWLITGDIWGWRVPYQASYVEQWAFSQLLLRMGHGNVILEGNHDAPLAFYTYDLFGSTRVVAYPTILRGLRNLSIVAFPYPSKRWVVGAEGAQGVETMRLDLSQRLFEIIRGLLLSVETEQCVLIGHCNIGGSRSGGGEILAGQEIELSKAQLEEFFMIQPKLRYIGLGHIHRPQEIIPGAWYAGTPAGQGWEGCNEHGFLIVDTDGPENLAKVEFIATPARHYYTLDIEWRQDECGWGWTRAIWTPPPGPITNAEFTGAAIKLRPAIPESQAHKADYTEILDVLRAKGATVTVQPTIIPHTRAREIAADMPKAIEAQENPLALGVALLRFWASQDPPPSETIQERALAILGE